jgi:hypothetical protein
LLLLRSKNSSLAMVCSPRLGRLWTFAINIPLGLSKGLLRPVWKGLVDLKSQMNLANQLNRDIYLLLQELLSKTTQKESVEPAVS